MTVINMHSELFELIMIAAIRVKARGKRAFTNATVTMGVALFGVQTLDLRESEYRHPLLYSHTVAQINSFIHLPPHVTFNL